jgi:hypothetical protein
VAEGSAVRNALPNSCIRSASRRFCLTEMVRRRLVPSGGHFSCAVWTGDQAFQINAAERDCRRGAVGLHRLCHSPRRPGIRATSLRRAIRGRAPRRAYQYARITQVGISNARTGPDFWSGAFWATVPSVMSVVPRARADQPGVPVVAGRG